MYTSLDFPKYISEHFPMAEKVLADYDVDAAELYKGSLSSNLTLLDFLERLEAFMETFDGITKGVTSQENISKYLFATTEYDVFLEGNKVIIREEYQLSNGRERKAEIPLFVYGSLLSSLLAYIKSKRYYHNGQTIISDKYVNGKRFGEWKAWFENGQLEFIGTYKNNIRVGEWKYYYDNGNLSCREFFDDAGKAIEIHRRWYKSGQLASERCFNEGANRGRHIMWDEQGIVIYSGKDQPGVDELLSSPDNSMKDFNLQKTWEEYVSRVGSQNLNPGLSTIDSYLNFKYKIPSELIEILELNNGQNTETEGVIKLQYDDGNIYSFIFLSAEHILDTLSHLLKSEGWDYKLRKDPHFIPFAVDNLKYPNDILCFNTKDKNIFLLWLIYMEADALPAGYASNEALCAVSLEEFIKSQILVIENNGGSKHNVEAERKETETQEELNNFKKNLKEQQLGNTRFFVSMPEGYFINEKPGPDFTIYYLLPSNKDNYSIGAAGIYIGGHPNSFFENRFHKKIQTKYHRFLEQIPEWKIYEADEGGFGAETYVVLGQFEKLHLFVNADSQDEIAKWAKMFETLKEQKEEGSENKSKGVVNGVITLYDFKSDDLKVNIEAYFEGENLVIDGYDLGKFVEGMFGDSDYEYKMTVPEKEVRKLYAILGINEKLKEKLLLKIYERYHGEFCFSGLKDFFDRNTIKYEYFSWT